MLATLMITAVAVACGEDEKEVPFPQSTPFSSSALEERLHRIRDRAAEVRELPVYDEISEGLISSARLEEYFRAVSAELSGDDRREVEATTIAFRLLHLIGPDDDLLTIVSESLAPDILGLYFPQGDHLVLIAEEEDIDRTDELVLAHEYIHSFQDGNFDIGKLDKLADEQETGSRTEYDTTVSCLQEGDATWGNILYDEEFFPDAPEDEPTAEVDPPSDTPPAIQRYFNFDYNECVGFVAELYRDGGWSAVDSAYKKPPWTTEQILHPQKYVDREDARNISPVDLTDRLGEQWEQIDSLQYGEFDVYNYLLTILEDEEAAAGAAEGWGAGWLGVYSTKQEGETPAPQEVVVHIALNFDTPLDFSQFMLIYNGVVDKVSGGNKRSGGAEGPVCWDGFGEFGYVSWDTTSARVDIVVSTQAEALDAATSDFLSGRAIQPCPV